MALDFHRLAHDARLLSLGEAPYRWLAEIFGRYRCRPGVAIHPYGDGALTVASQRTLLSVIEAWAARAALNCHRAQTLAVAMRGFRGLLAHVGATAGDLRWQGG
ncbi:hypothetical protein EII20_05240 [Comamonadaceae bacterium OH2545_COT-014]|nr:hypothetical protein EII20_05240 [Comamonadaceae bacterium OH2545_COT-014]